MDTRFKLKLSKIFNSCRNKPISDVATQPFFFPENHHHHRHLIDLFSPHVSKPHFPVAGKQDSVSTSITKKPKSSKKKKPHHRKPTKVHSFTSVTDNYYYDCCSSDDIDDETTLFSSKSFSSESSVSCRKNRARRKKVTNPCRGKKATDVIPIKGIGKLVKDSVAIVKKSSDPREDFRVSMLEMIVERQILGADDLESLLQCFLALNKEEHHEVICEVFAEIWETLFSDWL